MSEATCRVVKLARGYDLGAFDCGDAAYNDWLVHHAVTSVQSGVCAVWWPQTVPAWKLGKLAVDRNLREAKDAQWGRELLRDALETLVRVVDAGGGKVIAVDAGNAGLLAFHKRNGFKHTGVEGDLTLYMKVSSARKALGG